MHNPHSSLYCQSNDDAIKLHQTSPSLVMSQWAAAPHSTPNPDLEQHTYLDYSMARLPSGEAGQRKNLFPSRLYELLEEAEQKGFTSVISWLPHGRAFVIRDPEALERLLPRYFTLNKTSSFMRQVNCWGFKRITRAGPDQTSYYHECFLRGHADLAACLFRMPIKGTRVRRPANPEAEPNLWAMEPMPALASQDYEPITLDSAESNVAALSCPIFSDILDDLCSSRP